MAKLRQCLETACRKLAGQPSARLEAEILLAHALESPRSFLYANPELDLPDRHVVAYRKLVRRRLHGEPVAYIIGHREFWSLPLRITPDVLIPRHETELLVEAALLRIPGDEICRIADLGTGSGAIALAIASERMSCEVHATDMSKKAIALATENASKLGFHTINFHIGSWCTPLTGSFSLIVCNPPYIAASDPYLRQGDCRFEPHKALTPGQDPLSAIRTISSQAAGQLDPGGWLLLEHGADQGTGVRDILTQDNYTEIDTLHDLAGHERVTLGRSQPATEL